MRPVLVGWRSTTDAWNFNRSHFELRPDAPKLEEGSPAYTGIYALGAALELLLEVGPDAIEARIRELLARAGRGPARPGLRHGARAGAPRGHPHLPAAAAAIRVRSRATCPSAT